MELESFSHAYGQLAYHIVLVTKYRRQVLGADKKDIVKLAFNEIALKHKMKLYAIEVLSDHVHLFISAKPTLSPSKLLQLLKGTSARFLFQAFPEIKKFLWKVHLWSRGKFIRSVGSVTAEAIQHYIQESQEKHHSQSLMKPHLLRCGSSLLEIPAFSTLLIFSSNRPCFLSELL